MPTQYKTRTVERGKFSYLILETINLNTLTYFHLKINFAEKLILPQYWRLTRLTFSESINISLLLHFSRINLIVFCSKLKFLHEQYLRMSIVKLFEVFNVICSSWQSNFWVCKKMNTKKWLKKIKVTY